MGKFQFKYEPIKRVKEQLEKKVQKEIAFINDMIEKNKEKIASIRNEMFAKKVKFKLGAKAKELQFQKNYETYMLGLIEKVKMENAELEKEKNIKLTELLEKSKEKKILIKLEEKHLENFNKEENRIEAERVDEVATQGFIRGK
jgi:flagellar FliJ protein